jgi:hypothetical protein
MKLWENGNRGKYLPSTRFPLIFDRRRIDYAPMTGKNPKAILSFKFAYPGICLKFCFIQIVADSTDAVVLDRKCL